MKFLIVNDIYNFIKNYKIYLVYIFVILLIGVDSKDFFKVMGFKFNMENYILYNMSYIFINLFIIFSILLVFLKDFSIMENTFLRLNKTKWLISKFISTLLIILIIIVPIYFINIVLMSIPFNVAFHGLLSKVLLTLIFINILFIFFVIGKSEINIILFFLIFIIFNRYLNFPTKIDNLIFVLCCLFLSYVISLYVYRKNATKYIEKIRRREI